MGTLLPRKRKDGSTGYTALITLKRGGKIIHREAKTFDRKQAASAWMENREKDLKKPGGLERRDDPELAVVIDRYISEMRKQIGRTKEQVLRTIKNYPIAELKCSEIGSSHIVEFVKALPVAPQTRQNYLSHLGPIFSIARPAWRYSLDQQAIKDAYVVCKQLGLISKGNERNRRPTLDELDRLMEHFGTVKQRRPGSIPMQKIIPFAIFSTRRQEEITRIRWDDYQQPHNAEPARTLVRDMKHPGDKAGNDIWCELTPEAAAYIKSMPKRSAEIFPFTTDAVGAAFTRACKILGINTDEMENSDRLHFHDLRHEGVSRLFEMGRNIPQAAAVSGHRSWSSLKRYAHIRQTGDKYERWKWRSPDVVQSDAS